MKYYLCVLDFEAICWENSTNKEQMEIIEFPSALYKITEINLTNKNNTRNSRFCRTI